MRRTSWLPQFGCVGGVGFFFRGEGGLSFLFWFFSLVSENHRYVSGRPGGPGGAEIQKM